jgi:YD repeat-containing protein
MLFTGQDGLLSSVWSATNQSGTASFASGFDTKNRISAVGYSYDLAGNLLTDGFHTYTYDAESRMKTVDSTGASYTYGPDGERTRKDASGSWTEYVFFGGQVVAEKSSSGDWTDYIFAGGQRKSGENRGQRKSGTDGTLSEHGGTGASRIFKDHQLPGNWTKDGSRRSAVSSRLPRQQLFRSAEGVRAGKRSALQNASVVVVPRCSTPARGSEELILSVRFPGFHPGLLSHTAAAATSASTGDPVSAVPAKARHSRLWMSALGIRSGLIFWRSRTK